MNLFKKIFNKKSKEEQTENQLEKPIEEIKNDRNGYVSLGRSIFPVIKSENDQRIKMSLNNNKIISEKITEGIVKCFVLDMGDKFEMISESHLKDFGLDKEIVNNTAMRNLIEKINERLGVSEQDFSHLNPEAKPFFKVEADANYVPSLMLIDDFWDRTATELVKSDTIAVAIPAKNLLFFSDMKLMESFRTMKALSNNMYEVSKKENIELTDEIYIRKNGKWILFLDTPEQLEELW